MIPGIEARAVALQHGNDGRTVIIAQETLRPVADSEIVRRGLYTTNISVQLSGERVFTR